MFIKKSLMATIALLLLLVSCSSSKGTESVDVHEEASIPETPVETVSPYDVYEECYYDVQFKTHMYWLFDHDTNTGMFVSRSMRKNKAGMLPQENALNRSICRKTLKNDRKGQLSNTFNTILNCHCLHETLSGIPFCL